MGRRIVFCVMFSIALLPAALRAEEKGQADLDKAIDVKLGATEVQDLTEVIRLCQSALDKGLDKENKDFAEKLLASTLVQRGTIMAEQIFNQRGQAIGVALLRTQAINDLERAIKYDSQLTNAYLLLARLYALSPDDQPKAVSALDKLIALMPNGKPDDPEVLILRGRLQKDPEKRLADFSKAIELFPDNPEPLRLRAMHYMTQQEPEKALADFDKAIELNPDHADTYEARGLVLTALKRYDEAKESYAKAAELAPDSVDPYIQRARVSMEQGEFETAVKDLDKALGIDDKNLTALLMRAQVWQSLKQPEKAIEDVNRALEISPGSPLLLRTRAIFHAANDNLDAAITDLERVRVEEPNNIEVITQLATVYMAKKDHEKVIELMDAALEIDPESLHALRLRADAYLGVGRQKEAIADYEAALEINAKDTGVLNNLAWVLATSPFDELRDGERSIKLATEACELTEYKQAHILSTLAAGYAETGDFETAKKWSRKSVELADEEIKENVRKELESYEQGKKWRELEGKPVDSEAVDENKAPEAVKTAKEPAATAASK